MPGLLPISGGPLSALDDDEPDVSGELELSDWISVGFAADDYFLNVLETAAHATTPAPTNELLNVLFDSALALSDSVAIPTLKVSLTDSAALSGAIVNELIPNLRDRVVASSSADARAKFKNTLTGAGTFADTVGLGWSLLLQAAADADDTMEGLVRRMLGLADTLAASAVAESRLSAKAAIAVAAAMEARITAGWSQTLEDQVGIVTAAQNMLRAMNSLDDAATLSDAAAGSLRLSLLCSDTGALADALAANMAFRADLSDEVLAYCTFRLGATEYSGWAVNTDNKGVTEHRNQNFDAIVSHPMGFHYAAGPGGIVQITGDTDAGEPIEAWIKTFLTDYGTHRFKRAPDMWLGMATDGRMLFKALTRDASTGVLHEDWYEVVTKQDQGEAQGRAKIGRGLKSTWWGMELRNIDGADFRLDEIAWRMIVLDRRQ